METDERDRSSGGSEGAEPRERERYEPPALTEVGPARDLTTLVPTSP